MSEQPPFGLVRRGYDPTRVDQRIAELTDQLKTARTQLATANAARKHAEDQAAAAKNELRTVREAQSGEGELGSPESFGFRAERILRLAEHEASDVKAKAAREATNLVEQARGDAERHRHEVEQSLITRAAELDEEAAQRSVQLQEREKLVAEQLAGARDDAEQILSTAQARAEALMQDAQAKADALQQRTEMEARRNRETAEHELRRLTALHDGVRTEMALLHMVLSAELKGEPIDPEDITSNEQKAPSTTGS